MITFVQYGKKLTLWSLKACQLAFWADLWYDIHKELAVILVTTSKNGRNLKNSFVETIKERILSGELKPGDRMPPERELALEMGISRGSVNQGILDLERMGFIRVVPRKGAFVTEYLGNGTPETLAAIMSYDSKLLDPTLFKDLMDMRILIERECVRLACARMNNVSRQLLNERVNALYCADAQQLPEALYQFHLCIVRISGNSAYIMIFQSFEKMLLNLFEEHYVNEDELRKCLPLYDGLSAALSMGDGEEADRVILHILSHASDYLNAGFDLVQR